MDVAEVDGDIRLYKASAELLLEVRAKVPRLVTGPARSPGLRKWVIDSKVYEVTNLLDCFQEWPQLLDPYLATLIQGLVDAYLTYCVSCPREYHRPHKHQDELVPLPRAIARVLYAFCKVRGHKVIVRLLNNEPKYIEPLLSCFHLWTSGDSDPKHPARKVTWEERYIHLSWLAHLLLAPFELSTISGLTIELDEKQISPVLQGDLPSVSQNLIQIALSHLQVPSKAREAASALLVRLALRGDMRKLGLTKRLIDWATNEIVTPKNDQQSSGYKYIGLLSLLFGISNSASDSEAGPFLHQVFRIAHNAATSLTEIYENIRDSAPARKLLVKLMRSTTIHAISLANNPGSSTVNMDIDTLLEDCIQAMLDFLGDKDTPVRQAASKALSLICLKLDQDMGSEVVEAVIACFNENMLLEDIKSGRPFPYTDVAKGDLVKYKKNVNAVDPLKWHGAMLTLGHLLFRRSLPTSQLSPVIEVLLMGLNFEQRSSVGTSVGSGVRDAACFGVWSLARKYSTAELSQVVLPMSLYARHPQLASQANAILQLVAIELSASACLDPSGNLRRGSSAALQELIGRHPDAIVEGIPVVQVIDYHAVARRSRAFTEVAVAASKLDELYHHALLYSLCEWRGARATDAESRRQAACAVEFLLKLASHDELSKFAKALVLQIQNLKASNTGSNASARHGLLLCLASVIRVVSGLGQAGCKAMFWTPLQTVILDLTSIVGIIDSRVTSDIENVFEAVLTVISASANFLSSLPVTMRNRFTQTGVTHWTDRVLPLLEHCTVSSDKDFVAEVASWAYYDTLRLVDVQSQRILLISWLDREQNKETVYTSKGRTAAMGRIFGLVALEDDLNEFQSRIIEYFGEIVRSSLSIETKVNAMQSIETIVKSDNQIQISHLKHLIAIVSSGLADYTIDQRGDVGSLLRLQAIEVAVSLKNRNVSDEDIRQMTRLLARLAAEKLVKVRFRAWNCLVQYLQTEGDQLKLREISHQADVSSFRYFRFLLELLHQPGIRDSLIIGLISSVVAGVEEVSRVSSEALIGFMRDQEPGTQVKMAWSTTQIVSQYLMNLTDEDDREVIPAIDFLALTVEHVLSLDPEQKRLRDEKEGLLWMVCQKVHTQSSSLQRMEAIVRLYSSLTMIDTYRTRALDKLTRLLLHRWPKIRGAAADAVTFYCNVSSLIQCDWNAAALDNKPIVLSLRKELNVAGSTTSRAGANIVSVT